LHSHVELGFVDIGVGQEHPSFPVVRSEKVLPIFLFTFIYSQAYPDEFRGDLFLSATS
jgi:hypothetical protein